MDTINQRKEPETEFFNSEELFQSPFQVKIDPKKPLDQKLTKTVIKGPKTLSMDQFQASSHLVDGFVIGADKNILFIDRKGIFVSSVTAEGINFEKFYKFGEDLKQLGEAYSKKSGFDLVAVDNGIYFIPNSGDKIFLVKFNQKSKNFDEEIPIQLSMANSRLGFTTSYIHISAPRKSKNQVYLRKVGNRWRGPGDRFYILGKAGPCYVMDCPTSVSKSKKSEERYKKQREEKNPKLEEKSIRVKLTSSVTKYYDCSDAKNRKQISLSLDGSKLLVSLFELKTKKINSRRLITTFDLIGSRLEEFINMIRKEEEEGEGETEVEYISVKQVFYLKGRGKILGVLSFGGFEAVFLISNIFHHFKVDLKVLDEDIRGAFKWNILSETEKRILVKITFGQSQSDRTCKIYEFESSSLELTEMFNSELEEKLISSNSKDEKSYMSLRDDNMVLITTPVSSFLVDIQQKKLISGKIHKIKINLNKSEFYYLNDLLAWTSSSRIYLSRVQPTEDDREAVLRPVKEFNLKMLLNPTEDIDVSEFYFFHLENNDYMICFFYYPKVEEKETTRFIRLIIDPISLDHKEAKSFPGDPSLRINQPGFSIYQTHGFLVFCCNAKSSCLKKQEDWPNLGGDPRQHKRRLHLASLDSKILDRSFLPVLFDYRQPCPIAFVDNGNIITKGDLDLSFCM